MGTVGPDQEINRCSNESWKIEKMGVALRGQKRRQTCSHLRGCLKSRHTVYDSIHGSESREIDDGLDWPILRRISLSLAHSVSCPLFHAPMVILRQNTEGGEYIYQRNYLGWK